MRITQSRIVADFLYNLNNTQNRINTLQTQLSSGQRVNVPSDDPEAADMILRLNASIGRNEQFAENVTSAQAMLSTTTSALDGIQQLLGQLKTVMAQAGDGAHAMSLGSLGDAVDGILSQAVGLANTQFNGKYVFGGTQTQTAPYVLTPNAAPPPSQTVTYNGNAGAIDYPVGEGQAQQANVTGQTAFGGTALFNAIISVRDALKAGVMPTAADEAAITNGLNAVLNASGAAGTIQQSLDATTAQLTQQHTQLLALRSTQQDTDVALATLTLTQQQTTLQAALAMGAKILPMSLVNFLSTIG
ncbi:MAG TPA: flagellar hook-associated protein FlgL [Bacteroidota bacterium]|nr:flagellar hook-associated protein FlgL [Bacteroidota bacterium]